MRLAWHRLRRGAAEHAQGDDAHLYVPRARCRPGPFGGDPGRSRQGLFGTEAGAFRNLVGPGRGTLAPAGVITLAPAGGALGLLLFLQRPVGPEPACKKKQLTGFVLQETLPSCGWPSSALACMLWTKSGLQKKEQPTITPSSPTRPPTPYTPTHPHTPQRDPPSRNSAMPHHPPTPHHHHQPSPSLLPSPFTASVPMTCAIWVAMPRSCPRGP